MKKLLVKKIKVVCPICKSTSWVVLQSFHSFKLLKSGGCDLVKTKLTGQVFSPKNDIYENSDEVSKHYQAQGQEFREYAKTIIDLIPINRGTLLDVGCGFGWVVAEANRRGFEAMGIDPSKKYTSEGRKKLKINLQTVALEKFQSNKKFDVIILNHVLEHIDDLNRFLKKIHALLKINGQLVVACPNIKSLMYYLVKEKWYGLQPNQHIWQFSPNSLKDLLKANKLVNIQIIVSNLGYKNSGLKGLILRCLLKFALLTQSGDQVITLAAKK